MRFLKNSQTSEIVLCWSNFIEIVLSVENKMYTRCVLQCYNALKLLVGADLVELTQTMQKWKIWL